MALRRLALTVRSTAFGRALRSVRRLPLVRALGGSRLDRSFGIAAVTGEKPPVPAERGPAPVADEAALRSRYEASPAAAQPEKFVLYRVIGNDLVPRHRKGQSRENLRFILEKEPALPGCEKRFVVNRIVDPAEEYAIRQLLDSHGAGYLRIPFDREEYAAQGWDLAGLPWPGYLSSELWRTMPDDYRARLLKRLYRHKNNYIVNNNGARNAALADGRARAKWVLPWDGNCFLTVSAWDELRRAVEARPWYPYVIVPMARTASHAQLLEADFRLPARDEPQVLFRSDARETFNEEYYYSRRPKVELLWRLGVPGPWDGWAVEPWDLPVPPYSADAGAWQRAGWVARLPSGKPHLDVGQGNQTRRLTTRANAVTTFLERCDAALLQRWIGTGFPVFGILSQPTIDSSKGMADANHLNKIAAHIPTSARRNSKRRRTEASRILIDNSLPFLLDQAATEDAIPFARRVFFWLTHDQSALALRTTMNTIGTAYDLALLLSAKRIGNFEVVSRQLLFLADRALALSESSLEQQRLNDSYHRFLWIGIRRLFASCSGKEKDNESYNCTRIHGTQRD